MPLAEQGGRVAVVLKHARESGDRRRDPALRLPAAYDHIHNADSLLVATGEKRGPGRTADRGVGVEVREEHPLFGHLFDARCLDPAVVHGHIAAAQVVGQDDHNVGRAGGKRRICHRVTRETNQQANQRA